MRRSRMVFWIALLLALYGLSALFVAPAPQIGLPAGTSFSAAQDGAMALFDLLAHQPAAGAIAVRLEPATLAHWPQTPKNLLIIEPQMDNSARTDAWWLRLARRGHHVVELTDRNTPLIAALGLKWHSPGKSASVRRTRPSGAASPSDHARTALSPSGAAAMARLKYAPPATSSRHMRGAQWLVQVPPRTPTLSRLARTDARWLLSGSDGHRSVVGITRNLGAGSVTVLTLPSIAYNGMIGHANNLGPLLYLLQPWRYGSGFSETVHGFAIVPGILPLLGPGAGYAAALLAFALLLYVWSRGRRLGAVTEVEPLPEAASLALASALARHYRQRGDYDALARHVRAFLAGREAAPSARTGERPEGPGGAVAVGDRSTGRMRPRAYLELARMAVATLHHPDRPASPESGEIYGKEDEQR